MVEAVRVLVWVLVVRVWVLVVVSVVFHGCNLTSCNVATLQV